MEDSDQDLIKRRLEIVVFWYGDHAYVFLGIVAMRPPHSLALYPGREIDDG